MSLYKPSPLSFNSPRTSPFRRPESPASPSAITTGTTTPRASTPTTSPTKPFASSQKPHTPLSSPTKLGPIPTSPLSNPPYRTTPRTTLTPRREPAPSPTRSSTATPGNINSNFNNANGSEATSSSTSSSWAPTPPTTGMSMGARQSALLHHDHDPLSKLPPAQLREMREAFEILDRDMDGHVTRDDVADMLTNLGLPTPPQPFFPAQTPHPLPLAPFLANLSTLLSPLSPNAELLAAFAAFDVDDSGQIDTAELRDALIHTGGGGGSSSGNALDGSGASASSAAGLGKEEIDMVLAGFSGRRAFGGVGGGAAAAAAVAKGAGAAMGRGSALPRGDVFRYREFVASVAGAGVGAGSGKESGKESGKGRVD